MSDSQHIFNVQLVVKGIDRDRAYQQLQTKLNQWFCESKTLIDGYGYPDGSLLLWSTREDLDAFHRA